MSIHAGLLCESIIWRNRATQFLIFIIATGGQVHYISLLRQKYCEKCLLTTMKLLLLLLFVSVARAGHLAYYNHPDVELPYYNAVPQPVYTGIPVTHPSGLRTSTFYGNAQFLSQNPSYLSHAHQNLQPLPVKTTFVPSNIHIHKEVELQKPAIKTIRYELRRPAIQNKFYDIEERVIVRPVGSAVLELNQPHSKVQKSSVIKTLHSDPVQGIHTHVQLLAPAQQEFTSPAPSPANDESIVVEAEQQSIQKSSQIQPMQQMLAQEVELPIARQADQQQHPPQFKPTETISRMKTDQSITQRRLIELLTAREGVSELGFDNSAFKDVGDAGQVRVQVLNAKLAPKDAPIAGERVNTRRVIVSRPIETIEEVDVEEPAIKVSRVVIQKPVTPAFQAIHYNYPLQESVPVLSKHPIYYQ